MFKRASMIVLVLVPFCAVAGAASHAGKLNILMIGVDTLRADHLGCYGYDKPTSPAIDALAKESAVFENAMTQWGGTLPSLASIMTSLYPVTHGVRGNEYPLAPGHIQLAEVLKAQGYTCRAFLVNPVTFNFPWKGFDAISTGTGAEMAKEVASTLSEDTQAPFFTWLFLLSPHHPYLPPVEYAKRFNKDSVEWMGETQDWRLQKITLEREKLPQEELDKILALYDGGIACSDDLIGQVLAALKAGGKKDNTLIVFFADHGEELYDHQCYFHHTASAFEGVQHIPLIVKAPNVPCAARVSGVMQEIDIAPTLLDLLGVPAPEGFRGKSMRTALASGKTAGLPAVSEIFDQLLIMRTNQYRYIYNPRKNDIGWIGKKAFAGRKGDAFLHYENEELYDLKADPRELKNLAGQLPQVASDLRKQLIQWMDTYGWNFGGAATPVVDKETLEKLNSLGYFPQKE